MKSKCIILLISLVCISCSNKKQIGQYALLELQYVKLSSKADFVFKDQQGVLEEGLVSIFDTDNPTFREATHEDELKAIELGYEMETLKKFFDECVGHCKALKKLYKGKNILNSKKREIEIELYTQYIKITDESILKITNGIDPNTYINQYVSKNLREL